MKQRLALLIALLSSLASAANAAPCDPNGSVAPSTGYHENVSIASSGQTRSYALFVPPDHDPQHAYPLVFVFHAYGGSGPRARGTLALEPHANGAAIFVYPNATAASGHAFDLDAFERNPDATLVIDILQSVASTYCIDTSRIFATGFSRGGMFVNALNCRIGRRIFRATAPQAGGGPYGDESRRDDDGNLLCEAPAAPALVIHGEDDLVVPLHEGRESRDHWRWAHQCADATTPHAPAPCVAYDASHDGAPVVWCSVPDVAHNPWIHAPAATWNFFASFATAAPEPGSLLLGVASYGALLALKLPAPRAARARRRNSRRC